MDRKEFQTLAVRTEAELNEITIPYHSSEVLRKTLMSFIALSEVLDIYKKHIFVIKQQLNNQ